MRNTYYFLLAEDFHTHSINVVENEKRMASGFLAQHVAALSKYLFTRLNSYVYVCVF
jgi:hypothetical protein